MKLKNKLILSCLFLVEAFSSNLFGGKDDLWLCYNPNWSDNSSVTWKPVTKQYKRKRRIIYKIKRPQYEIDKGKQKQINGFYDEVQARYGKHISQTIIDSIIKDYKRFGEPGYIRFVMTVPGGKEELVKLSNYIKASRKNRKEMDEVWGVDRNNGWPFSWIGDRNDKRPIMDSVFDAAQLAEQILDEERIAMDKLKEKLEEEKRIRLQKERDEQIRKIEEDTVKRAEEERLQEEKEKEKYLKEDEKNREEWFKMLKKREQSLFERNRNKTTPNPTPTPPGDTPTPPGDTPTPPGDTPTPPGDTPTPPGDTPTRPGDTPTPPDGPTPPPGDTPTPPGGLTENPNGNSTTTTTTTTTITTEKSNTNSNSDKPTPQTKAQRVVKSLAADLVGDLVSTGIRCLFSSNNSSDFHLRQQQEEFRRKQNSPYFDSSGISTSGTQVSTDYPQELLPQSYPYIMEDGNEPIDPRVSTEDDRAIVVAGFGDLSIDEFDHTTTPQDSSGNSQQYFQSTKTITSELQNVPSYYETKKQIIDVGQSVSDFEESITLDRKTFGPITDQIGEYSIKIIDTSFNFLEFANDQGQDQPELKYALTELGEVILVTGEIGIEFAKDDRFQSAFNNGDGLDNILTAVGLENDLWKKSELGDGVYRGGVKSGIKFVNKWVEFGKNPKETFKQIGSHFVAMKDLAIKSIRLGAEASSITDLRQHGFHAEADRLERRVEGKIEKINKTLDNFYNGLSNMTAEETAEFFGDVLLFPFTPEGLLYKGIYTGARTAGQFATDKRSFKSPVSTGSGKPTRTTTSTNPAGKTKPVQSGVDGKKLPVQATGKFSQETAIKKLLRESDKVRKTMGNTNLYDRSGSYQQALEDFYSLGLENVKKFSDGRIIGQLKNGKWVNIHKSTEDKRHLWTLGVGRNKIRYL